jgi:hypothetical protein
METKTPPEQPGGPEHIFRAADFNLLTCVDDHLPRGVLAAEGCKIGRRHVKTLMRRMG